MDATLIRIGDWPVVPDYYTPCLIASEATIAARPETVRAFVSAASRGYQEATADPAGAAELLIAADPTAPAALIRASQPVVSAWYQAEAPRWGEQTLARWEAYATFLRAQHLLTEPFAPGSAFTTAFLP